MIIGSRQRLKGSTDGLKIQINIEGNEISRADFTKSLGVFIDKNFNWEKRVEKKCKKISSDIGALQRVRSFISRNTAIEINKALIEPHLDYCSPVWYGISSNLTNYKNSKTAPLELLQNQILRLDQPPFDSL